MAEYANSFDEQRYAPVLAVQGASSTLHRIFSDAFGDEYAREAQPFGFVTLSELRQLAASLEVAGGSTLVDLGCGRGGPGLWVAREIGCELTGVDVVPEAIGEAEQRGASFGLAARASFRVGSFTDTGLPAASFDAAMSVDALWMVVDKPAALRETARILRPGARFALTTWEPVYLDHGELLEAAGLRLLSRSTPDGWLDRQLAVYESIVQHETELVAELGDAAAQVLLAEAREAPELLAGAPRALLVAVRD